LSALHFEQRYGAKLDSRNEMGPPHWGHTDGDMARLQAQCHSGPFVQEHAWVRMRQDCKDWTRIAGIGAPASDVIPSSLGFLP